MSSILLDFHNKLGDNLICNGIVREYCKKYERVGIFCIPQYHESVSFMFRDLKNLQIEVVKNHRNKQYFRFLNKFRTGNRRYDEVKTIQNDPEAGIIAERQFYALAGVPHEKKWDNFFVERDIHKERDFFEQIAVEEPYIFIHDDVVYGSSIDQTRIPSTYKAIRPHKTLTNNIFDYCTLLERAEEIHVVDSAFMFLVDCLAYSNPRQKLFVHRYARQNPPWNLPVLKKQWTILL
ncbi:hypothetical protein HY412_01495 [Candidatus Kaiserbacteria bacterium]|nr:hypothetical protein [Candidatus Kaiserbacteria bacterium]